MKNEIRKIGLILFKYPLYKKGSYIQEFVDGLSYEVSENVFLIANRYPDGNFSRPKNVNIFWVSYLKIPIIGDVIFEFSVFLRGIFSGFRKADLINVVSVRGAFAAFLLGRIMNIPVVLTIEILNDKKGSMVDKVSYGFQKFVCSLSFDKVICWSKKHAETLKEWNVTANKLEIVPGGIDISRYDPDIDGSSVRMMFQEKTLIVFAKPMYEYNRKMAEMLLEAVGKIRDESIHVLLGSGEQKDLLDKKIAKLGLGSRVSYMPVVPITDIPKYLAASDIIVLPFLYEATVSRSLIEAMAMRKPIIVFPAGEVPDVVKNNKEAIFSDSNSIALAESIRRLISDKKLAGNLGMNARRRVEKDYSISDIAKKTMRVYDRCFSE